MTLHELSDEMLEIRRYVRNWKHHYYVKRRIVRLRQKAYNFCSAGRDDHIAENIAAGLRRMVVDPEILEGYLYGAAAEIREMALKQENADADHKARVREAGDKVRDRHRGVFEKLAEND